jgi:hypothetical protein
MGIEGFPDRDIGDLNAPLRFLEPRVIIPLHTFQPGSIELYDFLWKRSEWFERHAQSNVEGARQLQKGPDTP